MREHTIRVKDTGTVYRNPMPHVRSRHAYFPSLVVLPDNELLVVMDIGSAFEAHDIRSFAARSTDGGRTWTEPVQLFEPSADAGPTSVTTRVAAMPDGSLVGWVTSFDRSRPDLGLVNPQTDGLVRTNPALTRSTDGGRTWSTPRPIKPPVAWHTWEACSPVIPATDRRWLVPTSPQRSFEGEMPSLPPGLAFTSDDAGETWNDHVVLFDHDPSGVSALELKLTRLSDGRWLAVCWSIDPTVGGPIPNRFTTSDPEAKAFEPARSTGIHGETCTPLGLPDDHVLTVYRRYDQPGLWAQLAHLTDEWRPVADQQLWSGSTYLPGGNSGGDVDRSASFIQMGGLQFGYPGVARLPDGDCLVVFWCVERCVGNIRWIRLGLA